MTKKRSRGSRPRLTGMFFCLVLTFTALACVGLYGLFVLQPSSGESDVVALQETLIETGQREVYVTDGTLGKQLVALDIIEESPDTEKQSLQKLSFQPMIKDATGHSTVRTTQVAAEILYRLSEKSSLGLVASKEFHDAQDAKAWNEKVKSEEVAGVKYRLNF